MRFEEAAERLGPVPERLRVPLHGQREACAGSLEAFHDTVVRTTRRDDEPLGDAIDAYHAQIVAPRTAIIDRKAATSTLAAAFDAADRVLVDRLDKLIPLLALTQAAFATDYRNSRIIVDSGGRGGADDEEEESSSSSFPSSVAA